MKAVCIKEFAYFKKGRVYNVTKDDKNVSFSLGDKALGLMPVSTYEEFFKEIPNSNGYMVFVQNGQAPRKIHDCHLVAEEEAKRLSKITSNIGKTIYVCEIVKMFRSHIEVEEQ